MILGPPIGFAMVIAGLVAVAMKPGLSGLAVMQNLSSGLDSFPLLAIPFFILAAELMSGGALTDVLLHFAARLVGRRRGGLGHANILTLTFFSGISGSALADAAGPGAMLIKMMKKAGYSDAYAAALPASTAIVGPITGVLQPMYRLRDRTLGRVGFGRIARRAEGRILGAGLDVFEREPPDPSHPIFGLHNVVVTNHIGWW